MRATFVIASAVRAGASLSFPGAGIPSEVPNRGTMLREGQSPIARDRWLAFAPGAALFVTILALNLLGDGLCDALDSRVRGR